MKNNLLHNASSLPITRLPFRAFPPVRIVTLGVTLFCCALLFHISACWADERMDPSPPKLEQGEGLLQNTLFLPLKINASITPDAIATDMDRILTQILAAEKLSLVPRDYATRHIDYDRSWPPPYESIQAVPLAAGLAYVAAGTLTRLGDSISIDMAVFDLLDSKATRYFYRGGDSMSDAPALIKQIVSDILGHTGKEHMIAAVQVEGNQRIDTGAILKNVANRQGIRYNIETIREDIKNIYAMGYFDNIRVFTEEIENGKSVTFKVQEKEVIGQVVFVNNKELEEKELKDVITLHPSNIINPKEVKRSVDNILKLYKEKGYYNTEVKPELTSPKEGRVDVRFNIDEGKKVYIKDVRMSGNKAFSESKLNKIIETSSKGWFSWLTDSGVLKREILEQDAARIAAFYHNNGYIDAKVGEPEVRQEDKWLYVTFNISEGDRYKNGYMNLTGDLIEDGSTLLQMSELLRQEYFSRNTLREDILRWTDFYAEKGYAFAEITPSFDKRAEEKIVDVSIHFQKKDLVHVNRILVKGNTRTRDKVIRREVRLKEGEIYDATALKKSNQQLQRLGFFEEVNITPEPSIEENEMDVNIEVKEKPTGTFSLGAGYSSVDHFLFMGEISENNFLGRGQRLALQGNIGGRSSNYNFSFTEPHLGDTDLLFGFELYDLMREFDNYTKNSQGLGVNFGYPLGETWRLFWGYDYDNTDLSDVDMLNASRVILDSIDIHQTRSVRLGVRRDTRDKQFMPTNGSEHRIETRYAGGSVLGGDSAFTKFQGSTSWYFPFLLSTTLHLKGSAGYVTQNSGGKLPVYEKFYLGGIYSVRGFKSGHISPRDLTSANLDRIGGDKMWYYNSEIIFPLVKDAGLNGVVFLDAGNVYDIGEDWDFTKIKKSTGLGFRWLSPMGPLRLEWGYNLDPAPDDDQSNWDFSIGGSF